MSIFGSSNFGLPRLKPLSSKRSHVVSVLDIGSTKVVCMIGRLDAARRKPDPAGTHPFDRDHRYRSSQVARHEEWRDRRSRCR